MSVYNRETADPTVDRPGEAAAAWIAAHQGVAAPGEHSHEVVWGITGDATGPFITNLDGSGLRDFTCHIGAAPLRYNTFAIPDRLCEIDPDASLLYEAVAEVAMTDAADAPDVVVLRRGTEGLEIADSADAIRERLPDADVRHARTPHAERELVERAPVVTGVGIDEELLSHVEGLSCSRVRSPAPATARRKNSLRAASPSPTPATSMRPASPSRPSATCSRSHADSMRAGDASGTASDDTPSRSSSPTPP